MMSQVKMSWIAILGFFAGGWIASAMSFLALGALGFLMPRWFDWQWVPPVTSAVFAFFFTLAVTLLFFKILVNSTPQDRESHYALGRLSAYRSVLNWANGSSLEKLVTKVQERLDEDQRRLS